MRGFRLHGPQRRFELTVLSGPDPTMGWSRIGISFDARRGSEGSSSCLQDDEMTRLTAWFEAVAEGAEAQAIAFFDPELAFSVLAEPERLVQITLCWHFLPPWVKGEPDATFTLPFPAEPGQLRRAAASLRGENR